MKPGPQSNMSTRPPLRSHDDTIRDLGRVNALTEEPARIASQSLRDHEQEPMPWDQVDGKGVVSFNFKLPVKLAAKLKYLGETTYGESMTSIVTTAVTLHVDQMLKKRKLV